MKRAVALSFMLLLALPSSALATDRICDLEAKALTNLRHGANVTVHGRITESYGANQQGQYAYILKDMCGEALIGGDRPISCPGSPVTVAGQYDEEATIDMWGTIAIWAGTVTCE